MLSGVSDLDRLPLTKPRARPLTHTSLTKKEKIIPRLRASNGTRIDSKISEKKYCFNGQWRIPLLLFNRTVGVGGQ
ncbi:hypothetical protein I7I50_11093 [Histoplasma capsulatum G186AR]|uniref:Uncharacterized protein n=1 Tax=Ajellomyces capsulatus TaxID=5037 RepID=A0A8H7ZAN6_AJECA|nr:hypothetical protein I7I52_02332 [Histoplasma capsulatum]QSS69707.1 hypothetical protein I7I50_11093 [Histoplasma capsulatum G186AR]